MPNPYFYGAPVSGAAFVDREAELASLLSLMREGRHGMMVSPRRYGKTSLLQLAVDKAVAERGSRVRAGMVSLADVLDTQGAKGVAEKIVSGVLAGPLGGLEGKLEGAKRLAAALRVRPVLTVGDDGKPRVTLEGGRAAGDWSDAIADAVRILQQLHDEGLHPCLVIDEFQRLEEIEPGMAWAFKGLVDQLSGVSLIVCGSKRHLMLMLAKGPLKRIGTPMHLPKINEDVMVGHLRHLAKTGGKELTQQAANEIYVRMDGVPSDVQELAFWAFEVTQGRVIDGTSVADGMGRALGLRAEWFRGTLGELPKVRAGVVLALAREPVRQLYSKAFMATVGNSNTTAIRQAVASLDTDEVIEQDADGAWRLSDPMLRQWILTRVLDLG